MPLDIELSEEQKKIVNFDQGAIFVKASAGSGKTRVLTERIRYLLGKTKKKILALTFTNKAAREIRERLDDIDTLNDRIFVGTFHGFCQKILENHGALIGIEKMPHIFEDEKDRLVLMENAISITHHCSNGYKNGDGRLKNEALKFVSNVKKNLIHQNDFEQYAQKHQEKMLLYENYQGILQEQDAIDFDDLLLLAYNLLTSHPQVADLYNRSFYAICIDEAQDLNNAQYQLLLALTKNRSNNIMMVGDPNQSIFQFNGSSKNYMEKYFIRDYEPKIVELRENYRSSKSVIKAVKTIFPDAEDIAYTVKEGMFGFECFNDENDEAEWVSKKITEFLSIKTHVDIEGEISPDKIAILARNKYVFKNLTEIFERDGIRYYYKMNPGAVKFESSIMEVFFLALKVRLNPLDNLHKKRLMEKTGLNGQEVNNLEDIMNLVKNHSMKLVLSSILDLDDDGRNFKKQVISLKERINIENEEEKTSVLNDIDELLEHWSNYAKTTDTKSLHGFKNSMALGQTHTLTKEQGIALSTVHTMKGQEFDIVFLIGMDDGTLPDYRAIRDEGIAMTQEKNNLYVALTRAKRFLFITWPKNRSMPWGDIKKRNVSRFLINF